MFMNGLTEHHRPLHISTRSKPVPVMATVPYPHASKQCKNRKDIERVCAGRRVWEALPSWIDRGIWFLLFMVGSKQVACLWGFKCLHAMFACGCLGVC